MFTDEMLERLKDELLTDNSQIIISVKDGYALLARLEAAERFIEASTVSNAPKELYEAWLRSKGGKA